MQHATRHAIRHAMMHQAWQVIQYDKQPAMQCVLQHAWMGVYKLKTTTLFDARFRDASRRAMLWMNHDSSQNLGGIVGTKLLDELNLSQVQ